MKITKDIYIKATAEAMNRESTQKLFKADSQAFDMFSLFSFILFTSLEGKDVTEDDYTDVLATVIVDALPNSIRQSNKIKILALMIFSFQIWDELEKTGQNQTAITRNMTASKLN